MSSVVVYFHDLDDQRTGILSKDLLVREEEKAT
jgi:hypothetical protein